ncbi:MAG: hypothetical protein VX473_04990, partial [Candidatus Thermoplasmatota archaeon]|nr:hypothetical protein [Candidatus Thermoplasmatota archaeon]
VGITLIVACSLLAAIIMSDDNSRGNRKKRTKKKARRSNRNSGKKYHHWERKGHHDDDEEAVEKRRYNNQIGVALGIPSENWSEMSNEQKDDHIDAEEVEIKCPSCGGRCFIPQGYSGEICCWICKHVWPNE